MSMTNIEAEILEHMNIDDGAAIWVDGWATVDVWECHELGTTCVRLGRAEGQDGPDLELTWWHDEDDGEVRTVFLTHTDDVRDVRLEVAQLIPLDFDARRWVAAACLSGEDTDEGTS